MLPRTLSPASFTMVSTLRCPSRTRIKGLESPFSFVLQQVIHYHSVCSLDTTWNLYNLLFSTILLTTFYPTTLVCQFLSVIQYPRLLPRQSDSDLQCGAASGAKFIPLQVPLSSRLDLVPIQNCRGVIPTQVVPVLSCVHHHTDRATAFTTALVLFPYILGNVREQLVYTILLCLF